MKNYLVNQTKIFRKILAGLALVTTTIIGPLEARAIDGLIQTNNYDIPSWNTDTSFFKEPNLFSERVTNKVSKISLNGINLINGINTLKFYATGMISSNPTTYQYNYPTFEPLQGVILRDNHNTSWQISSITNLGKSPNIFGVTNGLVFVEESPTNTQVRFDNNTRVFNRDIYQVTLSTTNGVKYTNFNLDLDLITDDENTTNNNETCAFGNIYGSHTLDGKNYLDAYLNRVFGKMNQNLDASKEDWNTNGIPNSFEATYSGSPTNMLGEADDDGDRANNLQEYDAGTNPSDSNSVFKVTGLEAVTNTAKISWQGSLTNFFYAPISYSVESSTNLQDTNSWNTIASNINAQTYSDTNINERTFYRIKTETK